MMTTKVLPNGVWLTDEDQRQMAAIPQQDRIRCLLLQKIDLLQEWIAATEVDGASRSDAMFQRMLDMVNARLELARYDAHRAGISLPKE